MTTDHSEDILFSSSIHIDLTLDEDEDPEHMTNVGRSRRARQKIDTTDLSGAIETLNLNNAAVRNASDSNMAAVTQMRIPSTPFDQIPNTYSIRNKDDFQTLRSKNHARKSSNTISHAQRSSQSPVHQITPFAYLDWQPAVNTHYKSGSPSDLPAHYHQKTILPPWLTASWEEHNHNQHPDAGQITQHAPSSSISARSIERASPGLSIPNRQTASSRPSVQSPAIGSPLESTPTSPSTTQNPYTAASLPTSPPSSPIFTQIISLFPDLVRPLFLPQS